MADETATEPAAPVEPRLASTVMLIRDRPDGSPGVETWMLRRVNKMTFAPGMSVFPGGGVDAIDREADAVEIAQAAEFARRFGVDDTLAAVLVRTAIRETLEETGVVLDESHLRPWARWITPLIEPRRYDTFFFVALAQVDSLPAGITTEASHSDWIPVEQAMAEYWAHERPMLPPTTVALNELAEFATAAEAFDGALTREITTIVPVIRREEDGGMVADVGDGRIVALPSSQRAASGRQVP
ncbi:MAG: hydrolase [Frankiales bacterium]|nr:hydrolase [Frankiales bacterium]